MSNIEYTESILSKVTKQDTDVYGLKWMPTLVPHVSDDTDYLGAPVKVPRHFTELDHSALLFGLDWLGYSPKAIVEIGVDRSESYDVSSTSTILKYKPEDCIYLGIDKSSKTNLNDTSKNIHTLQCDSANFDLVCSTLEKLNVEKVDFMFVDGWHSVNQVCKEWLYWNIMSENGVMGFHDTNYHPGPVALMDAIDTEIFDIKYFGRGEADWGVTMVRRK